MIKKNKGFTLIELLVVIAIIGILSSVVLASLNSARKKARDARRMADLHQIQLALEMYFNDKNTYPVIGSWIYSSDSSWDTLQTALAPYIASLPKDPTNNAAGPWSTGNYSYAYGCGAGKYDLVAQFEDTSNNNRCEVKCWRYHQSGEIPWCAGSCGGYGYSPYLYADH
jgi:type II secretion system protein G